MAADITIQTTRDRAAAWLICGAFTALALVLRTFDLSAYGLDTDEVFSVTAARSTWTDMFSIVVNDKSHPPLHYIVLKLSLAIGGISETWARLPSVLFGIGLVPVAHAICRQARLKQHDEWLVLVLVATNSALIYFAQYARMFAALEFFAALSIWSFIRLWRDVSWRSWTIFTVVNVLMVYSHYWGWLMMAGQCLLTVADRKKVVLVGLSVASTAVAFLPWAVLVEFAALRQGDLAGQISWMGREVPGLTDYLWLIAAFNGLFILGSATVATRVGLVLFALPIVAFCARFIPERRYRHGFDPQGPGFWIVLIITPILLTSFASYIGQQNLWGERHLSMLAVPYYILIGLSLSRLKPDLLGTVLRCAILAWAILSSASYLPRDDKKFHFEVLAAAIARDPAPVYVSERFFIGMPLAYHLNKTADIPVAEQRDLPKIDQSRFWYVYRDTIWDGAAPETQFAEEGYKIAARVSTRWWQQTMTALLIEKAP